MSWLPDPPSEAGCNLSGALYKIKSEGFMTEKSKSFPRGRRRINSPGAESCWLGGRLLAAAPALALTGLLAAAAEQPSSVKSEVALSSFYSGWISGAAAAPPEKIELKNGKPDLSAVIRWIKKAPESDYDNFSALKGIKKTLLKDEIKTLCASAANPKTCLSAADGALRAAIREVEKEMSGRILYPAYYFPLSEQPASFVKRAFQNLDSNCAGACHSYPRAFFTDYPDLYQKLKKSLQAKGRPCQNALLGAMAGMLDQRRFPRLCLEKKMKAILYALTCSEKSRLFKSGFLI